MKRLLPHLLLLTLLFVALPAQALRCGTRLVDNGDRDFQVRQRCGQPFWIDEFSSVEVHGANSPYEVQTEDVYDAWYYNFGPQRFMMRLLFRNGYLVEEQTLGYGVSEIGAGCNIDGLGGGMPSGEIVARCGAPASHRQVNSTVVRRDRHGNERYDGVRREEWVYELGENRLVRILHLAEGRLESIETAETADARREAIGALDEFRFTQLNEILDAAYLLGIAVGKRLGPDSLRLPKGGAQ